MKRKVFICISILALILVSICSCNKAEINESVSLEDVNQDNEGKTVVHDVNPVVTDDVNHNNEEKATVYDEDPATDDDKLYVIFTVDVEDHRGNEPYLIEGELKDFGIEENCGVNYIMDVFEKYNSKAVFFVNIYEHNFYDEKYMPSLLCRMNERGHEVGLHSHNPSDGSLDFYNKSLAEYTLEEQKTILSYGRDYIYNAIGKYPIAYRAGAYRANDDTFKALSESGFKIDSSVYYGHKNNQFTKYANLKNQVFSFEEEGIEFPVEVIFNGSLWRKLDLNWLTEEEIYNTLSIMSNSKSYNAVQIMFHSFSFMDLKGEGEESLLQDGDKTIYGEDLAMKKKLNNILSYLSKSDQYEVITFEEYMSLGLKIPEYMDDNLIYLNKKELAFERKDVEVTSDGMTLFMNNKFQGNNLMYQWDVYNIDNVEERCLSGFSLESGYEMRFPENVSGLYYVKAWVRNSDGEKVSGIYYEVTVVDGNIESINSH